MRAIFFFINVVSDLKFGHFYFFGPPLTSATSEVGWKTSNFNVDFNVGKREEFGVPLCEIINFEHWRYQTDFYKYY
jgi:hypothetical protein